MTRLHTRTLCITSLIGPALLTVTHASPPDFETQLGVAHIGGLYSFSDTDYLNEGAAAARNIGARCIKVGLSLDTDNPSPKLYPFHSTWPSTETLENLADTPYFRSLFSRRFDTFILNAFRPGRSASYWREKFTSEDEHAEEECFASLTHYLLSNYKDSNKTFIIQNWEGDWALRGNFDPNTKPEPTATAAMIRWVAARQRGIERDRTAFKGDSAKVFHGLEVNLVKQAMTHGKPSVTTDVLPHVSVDLVSYSAWDTKDSPEDFEQSLAYISKHKRPTSPFDSNGVYVGEFGLPESEATPAVAFERTTELLNVARKFGCPYAVYWQIYCNERTTASPKSENSYKGFWLVRPDGTRSSICKLFK
jgi:hypothetical protein